MLLCKLHLPQNRIRLPQARLFRRRFWIETYRQVKSLHRLSILTSDEQCTSHPGVYLAVLRKLLLYLGQPPIAIQYLASRSLFHPDLDRCDPGRDGTKIGKPDIEWL